MHHELRKRWSSDPTDEELARAAKGGDVAAYDVLVRRHMRPAMALAWQFVSRVEDAEDVVQDAFHQAVRSLQDYDDRRPFGAWFYTIVRNVARTMVSKDRRRAVLAPTVWLEQEPAAPAGPDPVALGDIERAVGALAPQQQACLRLCEVEGFTSSEAAGMLGVTEGTVRTHLHRARKQLRVMMGTEQGTEQRPGRGPGSLP